MLIFQFQWFIFFIWSLFFSLNAATKTPLLMLGDWLKSLNEFRVLWLMWFFWYFYGICEETDDFITCVEWNVIRFMSASLYLFQRNRDLDLHIEVKPNSLIIIVQQIDAQMMSSMLYWIYLYSIELRLRVLSYNIITPLMTRLFSLEYMI